MAASIKGRSLLTLKDLSADEISLILDTAAELKRLKRVGIYPRNLENRNIGLIFLKPSLRTRMSFIVAAADEGAHLEIFPTSDIRFGQKESTPDIARVMGRLFDGIAFRGFEHALVRELAEHAGVPVWNGLCDTYHPTQVLADLLTLSESFGQIEGVSLAYVGDGRNNLAVSLMIGAAKMGLDFRILTPPELEPPAALADELLREANPKARITVTSKPAEALRGCHAIYNDVWVSMGEEHLIEERIALLRDFKVTPALMDMTGRADSIYMHCLPALHDDSTELAKQYPDICEVDNAVFEGNQSRVFDQAENRMHTIKAVMVATI